MEKQTNMAVKYVRHYFFEGKIYKKLNTLIMKWGEIYITKQIEGKTGREQTLAKNQAIWKIERFTFMANHYQDLGMNLIAEMSEMEHYIDINVYSKGLHGLELIKTECCGKTIDLLIYGSSSRRNN